MIELTFVLLLSLGGEYIEYTPYENLSECLSTRRKIQRNSGSSVDFDKRWVCKQMKVKLETLSDGSLHIVELVEEE
jgi:hypothetical protein